MVSDCVDWSENMVCWLVEVVDWCILVLGVCYGYQFLVYVLGGEVGYYLEGWEIGIWIIEFNVEV